MPIAPHIAVAIGALAATIAPSSATSQPERPTPPPAERCTVAHPTSQATVEVQMTNAPDFCELLSHALAGDVFHTPLLVTPGRTWHYPGARIACRLHYRDRDRLTVRNSPDTCNWLNQHATNWTANHPHEPATTHAA